MLNPNPNVYVACEGAMDRYMREEGISARRSPDALAADDDRLAGLRTAMQAVRRLFASHKPVSRPRLRGVAQGAASK